MSIYYIPIGSFCYPKMIIRETKREFSESLPFDFNSSPNLSSITVIMNELYKNKTYDLQMEEILWKYNGDELAVSEKNKMYLVHFFKEHDLIKPIENYPASIDYLKPSVVSAVKAKFKKRFERLLSILNNRDNTICFLRIENYENPYWKDELRTLTDVLSLFENPNKFLIYSQELIDENLHFDNSRQLNYEYKIPIFFYKYRFYDINMINNKSQFIELLNAFEYILNSDNIVFIDGVRYYKDDEKSEVFKMTDIKISYKFRYDKNTKLIIL
jgi:hypothetical protein